MLFKILLTMVFVTT